MNWYKRAKKEENGWMAVRVSKKHANKIQKWGKDNISNNILCKKKGYGRETDTHVTIIYGKIDNSIEDIKNILKNYKSIKVSLGKVGFFKTNPDFDVVIVKIISEDLRRLHEDLVRKLDIKETYSSYNPHSCIAYVENGKAAQFAGDTFIEGTKLEFDKIVFINSKDKETEIKL